MSLPSGDFDASSKRKSAKHLTETYDIDRDNPLGSGAFSTVFRCRNRKTGQVLALKQIDTRRGPEQSPRNIAHEIAMMKLAGRHENVIGCYAVQLEGPHVNIVVDMFNGGDLIDGLNAHSQARGSISDAQLAHILRQMVAAVLHIHNLQIVHRDVKGENFLSNMTDIGDSNCRIALADFGTAARLEPSEMLTARLGTSAYWAPEVWSGKYDHLVDIWALGATAFVLLAGKLPFDGEAEICQSGGPVFKMPLRTSTPCANFIRACLTHDPRERLKAVEAAHHPWLTAPQLPQSLAQERVKTSILRGTSVCGTVLNCFIGLCVCCVEVLAQGVMELCVSSPPPEGTAEKPGQNAYKASIEAPSGSESSTSRQPDLKPDR